MFKRLFKKGNKEGGGKDLLAKSIEELNNEIENLEEQKRKILSLDVKLSDPQIQKIDSQILKRKYTIMFKKSAAKDVWKK